MPTEFCNMLKVCMYVMLLEMKCFLSCLFFFWLFYECASEVGG